MRSLKGFQKNGIFKQQKCKFTNKVIKADGVVIGGGIGGSSISYELSKNNLNIICIDKEHIFGYHSTGRAAGLFSENYGSNVTKILSIISKEWFNNPPNDCITSDQDSIIKPAGLLGVSQQEYQDLLLQNMGPMSMDDNSYFARLSRENVKIISKQEALEINPLLNPDMMGDYAVYEPNAGDFDISLVHQSYMRGCRNNGVNMICDQNVDKISKLSNGNWEIVTNINSKNETIYECSLLINAANAWSNEIAILSGLYNENTVPQVYPKRRTIILFPCDNDEYNTILKSDNIFPWTMGVNETGNEFWYFSRQGKSGIILASPANTDDDEACDVQTNDLDIAICVDRIETYTNMKVNKIVNKWSGLRCYSADKNFMIGPDYANDKSFIWISGLQGQGVQAAPGYAKLCCDLVLNDKMSQIYMDFELNYNDISPNRSFIDKMNKEYV